jgi:hypothetical protein
MLKLLPWFFFEFNFGVCGSGIDEWFSPCIFDHFCLVLLGCLLSELMKYLLIERHLAAKTGTNFAVLI